MTRFDIILMVVEFACIMGYIGWFKYKNKKAKKEFNENWENYSK